MVEIAESPYKKVLDGPSRQLLWELGRLHIEDRQHFYTRLDQESKKRKSAHESLIEAAAAHHARVRKDAEDELATIERQLKREQEEIERRQQEKLEREQREQREREAREKKEIERRQLLQRREKEERDAIAKREQEAREERERQQQVAVEEARRSKERKEREREEAERISSQRKEDEKNQLEAAQKAKQEAEAPARAAAIPPPPPNTEREVEHQRYLQIHQTLKKMRASLLEKGKADKALKTQMGDSRRALRKCVGQLSGGKGANKKPLEEVVTTLRRSLKLTQPQEDITQFLFRPPENVADTQGPALLIYLLNIFAKAVISQYITEAGVSPAAAEAIGVMASSVFAQNDFRWNGIALVDILIAKFHVTCPILFGIFGSEATAQGKARLGWAREPKDGPWVPEQRHFDRMTGLGAGYASLTLRNYDKARLENPYPPKHFWRALSTLANVTADQVTSTHFTVIKSLIENNEQKIVQFFGDAGLALLRAALVDLPQRVGLKSVAAKSVAIMPDALRRAKKLFLI